MTKIGQAAWLCGSLPLGCIITYLEKFLLFLLYRFCPIREMVAVHNHWWYTFDTLKRNEWSVMCGPGCKTFLLNPCVFASRDTLSAGGPIPCHSWIFNFPKRQAVFICILYRRMWDASILLDSNLFVKTYRHYDNIWFQVYKVFWSHKVKTRPVFTAWSYEIFWFL